MTSNQSHSAESWEARDLKSVLHGFSHLGTLKESGPVVMSRGEGIYVEDSHGKRYLEGNSGLWNMVVGFDHPDLIQAACEQYQKFSGLSRLLWPRKRACCRPVRKAT